MYWQNLSLRLVTSEVYTVLFFSHGFSFLVASELKTDTSKFFENIEDVIAQADEVDDKYVQVSPNSVMFSQTVFKPLLVVI